MGPLTHTLWSLVYASDPFWKLAVSSSTIVWECFSDWRDLSVWYWALGVNYLLKTVSGNNICEECHRGELHYQILLFRNVAARFRLCYWRWNSCWMAAEGPTELAESMASLGSISLYTQSSLKYCCLGLIPCYDWIDSMSKASKSFSLIHLLHQPFCY